MCRDDEHETGDGPVAVLLSRGTMEGFLHGTDRDVGSGSKMAILHLVPQVFVSFQQIRRALWLCRGRTTRRGSTL